MCLAKGAGVVQLLAGLVQHEVQVCNIVVHLRVRWHGYWPSHGVMSWVVKEASVLDLIHILSTQTGKCFLHGFGYSIHPIVPPHRKPYGFPNWGSQLSSQICSNYPLRLFSRLIIEWYSKELGIRAS